MTNVLNYLKIQKIDIANVCLSPSFDYHKLTISPS